MLNMECVLKERVTVLEYMWETASPVEVTNIFKLIHNFILYFRLLLQLKIYQTLKTILDHIF